MSRAPETRGIGTPERTTTVKGTPPHSFDLPVRRRPVEGGAVSTSSIGATGARGEFPAGKDSLG